MKEKDKAAEKEKKKKEKKAKKEKKQKKAKIKAETQKKAAKKQKEKAVNSVSNLLSEVDRSPVSEILTESKGSAESGILSETESSDGSVAAETLGDMEASAIFRALGDDIRLKIVNLLWEEELCAAELLQSVSIVQSTLSHHMKILCDSGVVNGRKEGRWTYYSVNKIVMAQASGYLKRYLEG